MTNLHSDTVTVLLNLGPTPGDIDEDEGVDLDDFAFFATCMAGPDLTTPPPGCDAEQFAGEKPSARQCTIRRAVGLAARNPAFFSWGEGCGPYSGGSQRHFPRRLSRHYPRQ